MSGTYTQFASDAKEQVRQAINIVDLVGGYIDLRRQGRYYVGLCPWHNDSKPSLNVNPDRQTWKCWVCDIGGDIFSFVMQQEGIEFREALKMLADRAGIQLVSHERKVEAGSPDDKNTLLACCEWAQQQFRDCLLRSEQAEVARQYLRERGITAESCEKFKIGFAPNEWNWIADRARRTQFAPPVLEAVDLIARSQNTGNYFDRFKGRVIFPIHDTQGRTIAFGGRILPEFADERTGKYVNSSGTRLFSKSEQLYALDIARNTSQKSRKITVVEGYTDVIMCHQHGLTDTVAVLGTALTAQHIQLLKRFADTIYLVLDGDEAGQRRTNEVLELFVAANVDLRIMTPPDELDPCEFLLERSADEWRGLLDKATDALDHKIRLATSGVDLATETHKATQALEEILNTIAGAPRPQAGVVDSAALREQQILSRLARDFHLEVGFVRERLTNLRKKRSTPIAAPIGPQPAEPAKRVRCCDLPPAECELLEMLVLHPECAATALQDIAAEDISHEVARSIFLLYRRQEEEGADLDFGRVLAEIETPSLKSLLVQIDDQAAAKEEKAILEPAARMRHLIAHFRKRHIEIELRKTEAALESKLPVQEEDDLLAQLIARKRQQQGILATDA